jgi:hypothetical protein
MTGARPPGSKKAALMVVVKMTPRRGGSDQKLTEVVIHEPVCILHEIAEQFDYRPLGD